MSRVITLARQFLQGHPKAGQPTFFVYKALKSLGLPAPESLQGDRPLIVEESFWMEGQFEPKHHTIRFGRRWKTGDKASLRVWSGKPYRSPQIPIAPDVTLRVVDIWVDYFWLNNCIQRCSDGKIICKLDVNDDRLQALAANDGLSPQDFLDWFQVGKKKGVHEAQILIWGNVTEY